MIKQPSGHASSPVFFAAPGRPSSFLRPGKMPREWSAERRTSLSVAASSVARMRAPLGAPPRQACAVWAYLCGVLEVPGTVASGRGPGRLLARPDPAGFRPPSSAPRPAHEGQPLVVGADGDPGPPGCGVTSPARGRHTNRRRCRRRSAKGLCRISGARPRVAPSSRRLATTPSAEPGEGEDERSMWRKCGINS